MSKVIGIVGSRRRNSKEDYDACCRAFGEVYEEGDKIVSGGCLMGGDAFAERIARSYGLTMITHFADWNRYPKTGGFMRNTLIADDCDILIALVAADRKGGTEDTIKKAINRGKTVIYV